MARYLLADFIVEIENQYAFLPKQCAEYAYHGDAPTDITLRVSPEELLQEQAGSEGTHSPGYLESVCAYRKLCTLLPLYDAMLLHGSVIACEGRGIAFVARSGVGKTTHTLLWKQVYGEGVRIVNGDKPIIRFLDGVPYAYGTPWAGKEALQSRKPVPLTDICLIERGVDNAAIPVAGEACLVPMMQQVLHPSDPAAAEKSLELLDRLLSVCRFWVIRCNLSPEAAVTAHDEIIGE